MARELGAISELQAAETIIDNKNSTLGFDATTQEGTHVNSIHITTPTNCVACAVDELAGGTADDYYRHICDTVDNLALVHSYFHDKECSESKKMIITNVSNTMTDRCASNHAAIQLLNESWDKTLNELNLTRVSARVIRPYIWFQAVWRRAKKFDHRLEEVYEFVDEKANAFRPYLENRIVPMLKNFVNMPTRVRQIDKDWTNNNAESMNNLLKIGTNHKVEDMTDLIDIIYRIVRSQYKDCEKAIVGVGNYKLAPAFSSHEISVDIWCQKSDNERQNILKRFYSDKGQASKTFRAKHSPVYMDKTNDPVSNDQLTSFHCVHCGKPHKELYKQYSKDVLKLSVCNFCGNSVDKYVEFDPVLIMIDVLLQRCEAYRHMIYNMEIKNLWKLGFIIIFCDSYRKWTNYKSLHKDMNYEQKFFALEYSFYSMFSESCFELTSYSVAVLLVIKILIHFNHIDLSEKITGLAVITNRTLWTLFVHGQAYVAMSRTRLGVKGIVSIITELPNIVFKEIFD
ncbi:Protein ARV1 [Nymphon striatum]|nr:Protein ARV1 [Nymphon striatum]